MSPRTASRSASGSVDPAAVRRLDERVHVVAADRLERVRLGRGAGRLGEVGDERLRSPSPVPGSRASCRRARRPRFRPSRRAGSCRCRRSRARGSVTPAERSCFRNAPESGTNMGVKMTSGCGSALWIFVTTAPNSVWPILYVSSPTIVASADVRERVGEEWSHVLRVRDLGRADDVGGRVALLAGVLGGRRGLAVVAEDEGEHTLAAVADDRRRGVAADADDPAGRRDELPDGRAGLGGRHHLDVEAVVEQLLRRRQRERLVALVVLGDDLDGDRAAGRVDLLGRELHALQQRRVVGRVRRPTAQRRCRCGASAAPLSAPAPRSAPRAPRAGSAGSAGAAGSAGSAGGAAASSSSPPPQAATARPSARTSVASNAILRLMLPPLSVPQ